MTPGPLPRERRCSICHAAYRGGERFCPLDAGAIVEVTDEIAVDPLINTIIEERYFIRRFIGKGGMGAVYEADHVGLDRKVAVKVMLRGSADRDALARFRREARAASRVAHEHVVQIFDVGSGEGGVDYIAMELVEGRDLSRMLKDAGAIEPGRAIAIARGILRGLHAIHEAGIVHRDVKPANVLLASRDGNPEFVKLMDFGISKSLTSDDGITQTGQVVGTPMYMAPEQLLDEDIDRRADLYAVGVTLYQMLAGHTPFAGSTGTIVGQQVYGDPPPLDGVREGLPADLVAIVKRALEKRRDARFADALEFLAALDALPAPHHSDGLTTKPLTGVPSMAPGEATSPDARSPSKTAPTVGRKRGTTDQHPPTVVTPIAPTPPAPTAPAHTWRLPIAIVSAALIIGGSIIAVVTMGGGATPAPPAPVPVVQPSPLDSRCTAMATHVTQLHLQTWADEWDANLTLPTARAIVPKFADELLATQNRVLRAHCIADVWDGATIACMLEAADDTDCEFPKVIKHQLYSAYESELAPVWRKAIDGSPELAPWVLASLRAYVDAYARWHAAHPTIRCPDNELATFDDYVDADRRTHGADPFGGNLDYTCDEHGISIISKGPDHRLGTSDDLRTP